MKNLSFEQQLKGLLLGTAVGDALGLPAEGLNHQTLKTLDWFNWRHRFILGKGMLSDDTEHTLFVAQALLTSQDDVKRFERSLAWKFRFWLLSLPAGVGLATGRAIIKLWLGFPAKYSGVFSAGNGPAMRSAIIGAFYFHSPQKLIDYVTCSTRLTHTDPKAYTGALAVALAASFAVKHPEKEKFPQLIEELKTISTDTDWLALINSIDDSLQQQLSVKQFADTLGQNNGVSGYVYHTVPIALYSWLRHFGDYKSTLTEVLNCGGDTDTVGAITGALAGATVGPENIPSDWIADIIDWPRSITVLNKVAHQLSLSEHSPKAISYFWPAILLRNPLFFIIVLIHGFLRLIPKKLLKLLIS